MLLFSTELSPSYFLNVSLPPRVKSAAPLEASGDSWVRNEGFPGAENGLPAVPTLGLCDLLGEALGRISAEWTPAAAPALEPSTAQLHPPLSVPGQVLCLFSERNPVC